MNDSFNEVYTLWLKRYLTKEKNPIVKKLIDTIPKCTTIDQLLELIAKDLSKEQLQYNSIGLNTQLTSWKIELEQILENRDIAIDKLSNVELNKYNRQLIEFLQEILSNNELLLHLKIGSMLQPLCSEQLTELIAYIVTIPESLPPANPPSGSFAAQTPINPQHKASLALLNNVASAIEDNNPLWIMANRLLQSSLIIYKNLEPTRTYSAQPPLIQQDTIEHETKFCKLM